METKNQAQQPFFAKFVENQMEQNSLAGPGDPVTLKFPSDDAEGPVTLKFPSDSDEI